MTYHQTAEVCSQSELSCHLSLLLKQLEETFGFDAATIDVDSNFFMLGFDSLMLIRLRQGLEAAIGVDIEVEHFYQELDTPRKVAHHLAQEAPSHTSSDGVQPTEVQGNRAVVDPTPTTALHREEAATGAPTSAAASSPVASSVMEAQLATMTRLMEQQLAAISGQGATTAPAPEPEVVVDRKRPEMLFHDLEAQSFTPTQQAYIDDLVNGYNTRTSRSKALTSQHRRNHSDWITVVGYRQALKELMYPITAKTSKGARFVDVDGNTFVDIAMGYGVNFLGHSPELVTRAVKAQMAAGYHLGPQTTVSGNVARLLCQMTGCERAAFTNSGTESVMAALRIARTVTGRKKVAIFSGSFHGTYDGILAMQDEHGTFPLAPGIPDVMVKDVVILDYGTPEAIATIRELGDQLAAVITEPVQSRRPGFHPYAFLKDLRAVTHETGAALIFDEIITGFRIEAGGAQAHFDVRADMVTYGKVIGGGLPIGVLAGDARFLDAVDGGNWCHGDDSRPNQKLSMLSGTFCKHPLAMAAVQAVLEHIQAEGPALYEAVNGKAARMADTLNDWFTAQQVPVRIKRFGTLFRFESFGAYDLSFKPVEMDLLFYTMMNKGLYTWERRICFLSTQHTDADIDFIIRTVQDSVLALRAGGFAFGTPEVAQPLVAQMSSHQQRLYALSLNGGDAAYHVNFAIRLEGAVDLGRIKDSLAALVDRHESLRTSFDIEGVDLVQRITPQVTLPLIQRQVAEAELDTAIAELATAYDLAQAPLARVALLTYRTDQHLLVFNLHHLVNDGLSTQLMIADFIQRYGGAALPAAPASYRAFASWEADYLNSDDAARAETYWQSVFADGRTEFRLPRHDQPCTIGGTVRRHISGEAARRVKMFAQQQRSSSQMVLLAVTNLLLAEISGDADVALGTPVDVRPPQFTQTTGMFANTLVLRNQVEGEKDFEAFLEGVKSRCLTAYSHREYPFDALVDALGIRTDAAHNPVFDAMFVYERYDQRNAEAAGVRFSAYDCPVQSLDLDLELEWLEEDNRFAVHLIYAPNRYPLGAVECWANRLLELLELAVTQATSPMNDWLQSEIQNAQARSWWQETLAGAPTKLTLPTDHSEQVTQELTVYPFTLSSASIERHLSHDRNFEVVLAACFGDLLSRLCGMNDLVLGFVGERVLPLRMGFSPKQGRSDLTVGQHLDAVEAFLKEGKKRQLPASELALLLHGNEHGPLSQAVLALNTDVPESADLALQVSTDGGLQLQLVYNGALFSPATIQIFGRYFSQLYAAYTEAFADTILSQLSPLDAEQRLDQLSRWNATATNHDTTTFFHRIFEGHAAANPQKLAAIYTPGDAEATDQQTLTYGQLNARANQLARHLLGLGLAPETVVAVCTHRGLDMLTALLATLKAGLTYLPIEPNYPSDRIQFILEDAGCSHVVTHGEYADRLENVSLICLDQVDAQISAQSDANLDAAMAVQQLAYVIYTSGSTGKPKGALLHHAGMLNHLRSKVVDLQLTDADIVVQNASQCFDISIWQYLVALLVGGTTQVYPDAIAHDPARLMEETAKAEVTILEVVPSLFQPLFAVVDRDKLPALDKLRFMLFTGEALSPALCANWLAAYPAVPIVNAYGPTECSDDVTHHTLAQVPDANCTALPIGRPIINTQVYVLDRHLQPLPLGAPGELYIGGAGLGRGYMGRGDLTADRFIPNPFSDEPGARLYRTGDLVRFDRGGDRKPGPAITFLGRIDFQVKVNGFRIELSEIEHALNHLDDVDEAVVLPLDVNGDTQLVAYVIAQADNTVSWREHLSDKLPHYMVPAHMITLDAFPVTTNGKLDKKALPQPKTHKGAAAVAEQTAETPMLAALRNLWCEILSLETVNSSDNFFELGGNSIKGIVLLSKIRQELDLPVTLETLFAAPTLGALAQALDTTTTETLPPIGVIEQAETYALSSAQKRLWLACQMDEGSSAYSNYMSFILEGDLDVTALEAAFQLMIARHEIHRASFPTVAGEPRMRIAEKLDFALPIEDLSNDEDPMASATAIYEAQAQQPFDLANGPLLRAQLLYLGSLADTPIHVLIFCSHHIISDGWSNEIFTREIFAAYKAFRHQEDHQLEPLRIQYKDYAAWHNDLLVSDEMKAHQEYWLDQLNGAPAYLELPTDAPREDRDGKGQIFHVEVDAETTAQIHATCKTQSVSLFMFLQAALKVLLHQRTGSEDIILGSPIAGRIHPDLSEQIGFYLNMLPLRDQVSAQDSFASLVERVKQTTLEATAHEAYPFDAVVEDRNLPRNAQHHPLFDIIINVIDFAYLDLEMDGVSVERFIEDSAGAKFDLDFVFEDRDELAINIEYATALFEEATVNTLAHDLIALLRGFAAHPQATVAEAVRWIQPEEELEEQDDFLATAFAIDDDF